MPTHGGECVSPRSAAAPGASVSNLVAMLRDAADRGGEGEAITFLTDEDGPKRLSYQMLDRGARAIAAELQHAGVKAGERLLLLYPPGVPYLYALFGAFYASAVPVPAYPPDPARLSRTLPRLIAILADAQASSVLTLEAIRDGVGELFAEARGVAEAPRVLATDRPTDGIEDDWGAPRLCDDDLAVIQYTSGSTAAPRGVMLSHGNLLRNMEFIHRGFGLSKQARSVQWLPPYHDMGLIGGILSPIYGGFPVTLLSPLSFLRSPMRWLRAISEERGTHAGGPNFAFDLCVRRITAAQRGELDLSSWRLAFNGAEPIRKETIDSFSQTFADCGFVRRAFYPCYGLAEGTLMVTGAVTDTVRFVDADQDALERSGLICAPAEGAGRLSTFVGCGKADADHEVVIVDPASAAACAEGQVGEIWVRGPSVAGGYYGRAGETTEVFGARMVDGAGPYLRTGDLGFLLDQELFVAGRLKDLIIIGGRNFYPTDIELACSEVIGVRANCSAAFGVQRDGVERLVVACEVSDHESAHAEVIDGVRREVAGATGLQVHTVVLIRPRTLPKTSSGKVQRHACSVAYESGELDVVTKWTIEDARPSRA